MARHSVRITMPDRKIQKKDVEFIVTRNRAKLGTLSVSQGTIDWTPAGGQKPYKMGWKTFDSLMQEKGRKS
jgi:hypothetical protein